MFRDAAVQALGGVLMQSGELLPLECREARLAVFNPTRVLDALDEASSETVRFAGGRIMREVWSSTET